MSFLKRIFGREPESGEVEEQSISEQPQEETAEAVATLKEDQDGEGPTEEAEVLVGEGEQKKEDAERPPDNMPVVTGILEPMDIIDVEKAKLIQYGQMTDVGKVRDNNQDALFSMLCSLKSVDGQPDFGLFVVADGMGGYVDGEKASALSSRTIGHDVLKKILLPLLLQVGDQDADQPTINEILSESIQKSNDLINDNVPDGGTTTTAVVILGDMAYIAHVGDTRVYLIKNGEMEQITRDHSVVQRLVELQQLTPEEAAEDRRRNILYRALGQTENLEVDLIMRRLTPSTKMLICSDGLWNMMPDETILSIINQFPSPQETCDHLVAMANEMGGQDNITTILIQMPG
jgi:serine/threonine protein phosphatase PrpC